MNKIIKIIGAFLCIVSLPFIAYFAWSLIYSATSVTYLESKPEDTYNFGKALAINDSYIAVGDPEANRIAIYSYIESEAKSHDENEHKNKPILLRQCVNSLPRDSYSFGTGTLVNDNYLIVGDSSANRVIIYTRDSNNKWLRTREISAPKNSTADKLKSGFGNVVGLDGNTLIIGSFTVVKEKDIELVDPEDFYEHNGIFGVSSALYQTRIDRETEVEKINLPGIPNEGVIPSHAIVAEKGKIAFVFSHRKYGKRINQIYVLEDGKITPLPFGKFELKYPRYSSGYIIYGVDIALKNNLLLISVDKARNYGGVWLFDLNSPQIKPRKIALPDAESARISVAISEEFMAVGNTFTSSARDSSEPYQLTLIKNIATGSTKVVDGGVGVSLDGNILRLARSDSDRRNASTTAKVFRLDRDATPHLIKKYRDVQNFVQNGLLITKQKTEFGKRICTEQIH